MSTDGRDWGPPRAKGAGNGPRMSVPLVPKNGRFVKILQTGATDHLYWSIHELQIAADKRN